MQCKKCGTTLYYGDGHDNQNIYVLHSKRIVRRRNVTCTKICSDTNNESLSYIIIVGRDCMCIEK